MSSSDGNKALILRMFEAINTGRAAAREICSQEVVLHSVDIGGLRAFIEQQIGHLFVMFPDASASIDDVVAEGGKWRPGRP